VAETIGPLGSEIRCVVVDAARYLRRSHLFQPTIPGEVSERIAVAISWESMKSIALSGDH